MENFERTLSINRLKFYNNMTNYISQFQDVTLLEQHYLQKTKLNTMKSNIHLPAKDTKTSVRCPRCCTSRKLNNSQFKISPAAKRNGFLNRIKRKIDLEKLTRYQLKYAKRMQKSFGNQLVIKCKICHTETKEILQKPARKKEYVKTQIQPSIQRRKEFAKPQVKSHTQSNSNKPVLSLTSLKHNKKKDKRQNNRRNNMQIDKLNKLLNTSQKVKSTSLKDFIKSVV